MIPFRPSVLFCTCSEAEHVKTYEDTQVDVSNVSKKQSHWACWEWNVTHEIAAMVSPEYSFRQLSFSLLLSILNQNSKIVSQWGMTGFEYRLGWCFVAFKTVCDVMLRNVLDVCIYWCGRRVNICLKKIYFLSVQRSEIFNICIVTF